MEKILSMAFSKLPCLFLLLSGTVFAKELPNIVLDEIEDIRQTCKNYGGIPRIPMSAVHVLDITEDGKPDYIIDYGEIQCEGQQSVFSGIGSYSDVSVYISSADGKVINKSKIIYADLSPKALEIDANAVPPALWITVSGPECGQDTDNISMSDYRFCKRSIIWSRQDQELRVSPLAQARWLEDDEEKPFSSAISAQSAGELPAEASAMQVDIRQLLDDYEGNEVAADNRYQNNLVEVTGIIYDIKKDFLRNLYLILGTENQRGISRVQAFFDDSMNSQLASLRKGQKLTVVCTIKGLMMNVVGENCIIK